MAADVGGNMDITKFALHKFDSGKYGSFGTACAERRWSRWHGSAELSARAGFQIIDAGHDSISASGCYAGRTVLKKGGNAF